MINILVLKLLKHGSLQAIEVLINKLLKIRYPHWSQCFGHTNYIIEVHCRKPNKIFFVTFSTIGLSFAQYFQGAPDILIKCDAVNLIKNCLHRSFDISSLNNIEYFTNETIKDELRTIWQKLQHNSM